MSVPKTLTGTYQVYCPDPVETPIVLHVRTPAVISPVKPAQGRHFQVAGFQTEVTFPQGLAFALSQMSPITGKVAGTVLLLRATPSKHALAESFVAIIPASLPAAGFNFWVPGRAVSLGVFTATAKAIVVEEASRFQLTLEVGKGSQAETRVLACTAFANATQDFVRSQPWVGTKEPPPLMPSPLSSLWDDRAQPAPRTLTSSGQLACDRGMEASAPKVKGSSDE
jgi:hypothetical protein